MTDLALSITPPPGPGWVQLPAEEPRREGLAAKIFGRRGGQASPGRGKIGAAGRDSEAGRGETAREDKALTDWAAAQARQTLGPESSQDTVIACARTLMTLTRGARDRGEKMAFAWFPGAAPVPAAQLSVSEFGRSGTQPDLTLDLLEEKFAWRDDQTTALQVTRLDLPGGPALRVHREQSTGTGPAPEGGTADGADAPDAAVSVTYAVLPPRAKTAIILTMYWARSDDEPVFAEIADATAKTLRVTA